eukprot:TRINITY_DN21657_c0_g1_i1.p1 TRINITY_DN21657_c0_g1~~TRINITY_DN21657_c0_g1_i1.p1  ORF type:complete len:573 (+),score=134.20 TRINITY_DN21657_c0_g1_i1:40-1719(+)
MGYGLTWGAWVVVVGAVFLQLSAGHIYLFGTYSNELKYVLFSGNNDAQTRIQSMALAGNIGCYLPLSGTWYDSRFGGPTTTAAVGALLTFPGYYVLYKAINGVDVPYVVLLFVCGLWGSGASFFNTCSISTCIRNFPNHRGMIIGMLASFFGLSASVLVQAYVTWFKPAPLDAPNGNPAPPTAQIENDVTGASNFLLFLALGPPIMALISVVFISRTKPVPVSKHAATRFHLSYLNIFCMAIVLLASGIYTTTAGIKKGTSVIEDITMYLVIAMMLLFLGLPYKAYKKASYNDLEDVKSRSEQKPPVVPSSEISPLQALKSLKFYLMFASLFPIMGGGLMVLNNIAQILKAKNKSDAKDVMVQLMSVFNCFARLTMGILGDYFAHKFNRPTLLSFILATMGVAHLLLALPIDVFVIPGACLSAFAYGCAWSTFPPLIADLFGFSAFATMYSLFAISACLGSLICSTFLASKIYEYHTSSGETDCYGDDCYQLTHIILIGMCIAGLVCSVILNRHVKHVYTRHGTDTVELADNASEKPSDRAGDEDLEEDLIPTVVEVAA